MINFWKIFCFVFNLSFKKNVNIIQKRKSKYQSRLAYMWNHAYEECWSIWKYWKSEIPKEKERKGKNSRIRKFLSFDISNGCNASMKLIINSWKQNNIYVQFNYFLNVKQQPQYFINFYGNLKILWRIKYVLYLNKTFALIKIRFIYANIFKKKSLDAYKH